MRRISTHPFTFVLYRNKQNKFFQLLGKPKTLNHAHDLLQPVLLCAKVGSANLIKRCILLLCSEIYRLIVLKKTEAATREPSQDG